MGSPQAVVDTIQLVAGGSTEHEAEVADQFIFFYSLHDERAGVPENARLLQM